jgi:glutamate synthase domain-containing protein 3
MDLKNAHAVVNYNSSPTVVAAIEGVPIFVLDPERSQAKSVANTDLLEIETPKEFDREKWIQQMAQMHWTLSELKDGTAWRHLRQWAKK